MNKLNFKAVAVIVSLASSLSHTHAQSWLTNGLVAHYPFNGNANDASGNGNNGIINGATLTTDRFNRANSAYYFDGNSWITMPQTRFLDGASNATISVWVVIKSGTSGEILAAGDERHLLDPIHLHFASQNADLMWFQNTTLGNVPNALIGDNLSGQTLTNFTADTWHQISIVLSTNNPLGTLTVYVDGVVNGVQIGSDDGTPFTKIAYDVDMPFLIGAITYSSGPGEFWSGKIDDIRIYNRALSSNEVAQLYAIESTTSPRTATGAATVTNGFVIGVTITDTGYGYTNTPLVRFIGGGGSGAAAYAVVSNGVVTSITVTNAGYGYTNAPLLVIEPPFIPNPVLAIAPMSFLSFSNLTVGGAYQMQQFAGWYWANQPVSFTATNAHYTQMVAGVWGSGDFRLALNPVPAQAFATAQVVNGFVVGATVTSGGSGYVTSPAVNIVGKGGTNATAVSHISGGAVTSISITSAGIGYTNTPTVQIAQPPAAAVSPAVLPVMRVDSASLAPYDNYQIQFTPAIGETWGNWNGGLFSPTDVTNSQFIFITNGTSFFRLQYVP
ncbi:MAG TPA: LamG domain-containing protein [Candidatus Limnocylindrales bacterium]|nr:LamG domain-containing protein [Candidatus Limnocylindrales bacterium]